MQTIFRRYFPQRSFSLQVFCYCLKLRLRTVLRITISLLKCRCSLRLVQGSPFSYTASIDSNSSSCFALTHFSFSAGLRSSQSIRCAYFPSGHSYAPSLIDSTFPFSLSLKKGAYQTQRRPGFTAVMFIGSCVRARRSRRPLMKALRAVSCAGLSAH